MTTTKGKQGLFYSFKKQFYTRTAMFLGLFFICTSFIPSDNGNIHFYKNEGKSTTSNNFSTCQISNTTFDAGEKMTHKVFYNWNFIWMSAGESTAQVIGINDQQHLIDIKGRTYKSFDWFYKIRDHYTSTIKKETLTPSSSMRYIEEGKYTLYDKVNFNTKNNKATSIRGKSKETAKTASFDVDACMHDLVSMVYYLRNVDFSDLEIGDELPMQIFMDRKTWNIQIRYEGRKIVKVKDKGKYLVNKVTTRISAGELFDENSYVSVYISTDKNQVPLLVKLELSVGSIQVVLKDYKNLKHPFSKPYQKKKS